MQIYHVFTKVHTPAQSDLDARVLAQVGIMLNGTTIDGVVFGGPAYNSQRIVRGDVIVEAASPSPLQTTQRAHSNRPHNNKSLAHSTPSLCAHHPYATVAAVAIYHTLPQRA